MGYLTQSLISESTVFKKKIGIALVKKIDTIIQGSNQTLKDMAKVVMKSMDRFVEEIAKLLALDGLDLDSSDAAIDTAIAGTVDWLTIRTEK